MSVGCWNVRTLLDRQVSGRPERQTALVCEELCRLDLDIVALSETHLSAEDHLKEISSDLPFSGVESLLVSNGKVV